MVQSLPMRGGYVLSVEVQGRPPAKPGGRRKPVSALPRREPGLLSDARHPVLSARTPPDCRRHRRRIRSSSCWTRSLFAAAISRTRSRLASASSIGNGTSSPDCRHRVGDVLHEGLDENVEPTMYAPFRQDVFSHMWMLAQSDGCILCSSANVSRVRPAGLIRRRPRLDEPALDRQASRSCSAVLTCCSSVCSRSSRCSWRPSASTASSRTAWGSAREIGLRLAIGAAPADVLKMVVGGGMKLALVGVVGVQLRCQDECLAQLPAVSYRSGADPTPGVRLHIESDLPAFAKATAGPP